LERGSRPVCSDWEVGDSWIVRVDIAPESDSPKHALVHIAVTGSESLDPQDECWRLEFAEDASAVARGNSQHRRLFLVSKRDGRAKWFRAIPGTRVDSNWTQVPRYGPLRLPYGPSSRFPTEILPAQPDSLGTYSDGRGSQMVVSRDQVVDVRFVGPEGRLTRRVRQVWPAGAKWWSEYESWGLDGKPCLRARLVTPEELAAPAVPSPVESEAQATAHAAALRRRLDMLLEEIRWPDAPELSAAPATAIRMQLDAGLDMAEAARSKVLRRWTHQRAAGHAEDEAEGEADGEATKGQAPRPEA
jgi:hypothetical protein